MAGNSGFHSRCDRDLWAPFNCMKGVKPHFEIVEGTRDCSLGAAGTNGLMSRGQGNLLAFGGRTESDTTSNLAAAAAAVRGLRFFSSYTMELREPLVLPQGSQVSMQVARGLSGFLSSQCRGLGPHLELWLKPVLTWISGYLWSFNRGVRPHLVQSHGSPLASRAVKVVSGFLSG